MKFEYDDGAPSILEEGCRHRQDSGPGNYFKTCQRISRPANDVNNLMSHFLLPSILLKREST
jgi:hypothetical protein